MLKGTKQSEEAKKKIREARKKQITNNKGKHWKVKNTSKMSEARKGNQNAKGYKHTKEAIEK